MSIGTYFVLPFSSTFIRLLHVKGCSLGVFYTQKELADHFNPDLSMSLFFFLFC